MNQNKRLPSYIKKPEFIIKRLFPQKDMHLFYELIEVYKNNRKHLYFWHCEKEELIFNNSKEYISYLKYNKLLCYVIIINGKIIGCIEIGILFKDYQALKCRYLTFWLDKYNINKNIMFNALNYLIIKFKELNTDYFSASVNDKNIPCIKLFEKMGFYILTRISAMDVGNNIIVETIIEYRLDLSNISEKTMKEFKIKRGYIKK